MKIYETVGDYSVSGTRRMQSPGNIRSGRFVRGSHSSLQQDLQDEEEKRRQDLDVLPKAVVIYVAKGNKILTVSRGSNLSDKNLPGGCVEEGEQPEDAAARELWEETGLRARKLIPIYASLSGGRLVTTYVAVDCEGPVRSSSEGVASWSDPEEILRSSYGEYFTGVISVLLK